MLKKLRNWLKPPQFEGDEEIKAKIGIANELILTLGAAILLLIFVFIPLFAVEKTGSWILSIIIFLGLAIGRERIVKGSYPLGILIVFSIIYLCILAMLILSGGQSGTAVFYFASVVMLAGFFLDARLVNGLTLATFLCTVGLAFFAQRGLIKLPTYYGFNPALSWIATGLGLLMITRARTLFNGYLKQAFDRTKQESAARQEAETIFRRMVETANEGMIVLDPNTVLTLVNEQAASMLGFSITELLGQKLEVLIFEEDLPSHAEQMKNRAQGKKAVYERSLRRKDGGCAWALISATPTFDAQGHYSGAFSMITDITNRVRSENALRVSEEKFEIAFRKNPAAILLSKVANAQIIEINETFTRIFGYTREEIIGSSSMEKGLWADPLDREKFLPQLIALHSLDNLEIVFRAKDGRLITCSCSFELIDVENEPHVLSVINDISERKLAESALRESELRYRTLFEKASDGIFYLSTDGTILAVNEAFARMHGYTVEEMPGMRLTDLDTPESAQLAHGRMSRILAGEIFEFEVEHYHKDGHVFPISVSTSLITLGGQQLIQAIHRDITERKNTERALQLSEQTARQAASQLQMVNQIGLKITAGLDLARVMQTIYEQCQQLGQIDTFYLALFDTEKNVTTFPISYSDGEIKERQPIDMRKNPGIARQVIETRQSLYIPDLRQLPQGLTPFPFSASASLSMSYLAVPLIINEDVIGLISMQNNQVSAYTPDQIKLIEMLATQVAIAIQNSLLYGQVQNEKNQLQKSEAQNRAIVQTANEAIITINMQGVIVDWNPAAETIFGYAANEAIDMPVSLIMAEHLIGPHLQAVEQAFNSQQRKLIGKTVEVSGLARDGREFPIEVSLAEWQTATGIFFTALIRDITERKRAEATVLESEARFREVLENSLSASYKRNLRTNTYDYLSPVITKLTGYITQEFSSLSLDEIFELIHPDDHARGRNMVAEGMNSSPEAIHTWEYRFRHKSGRYRWILDQFTTIHDAQGQPIAWIGSIRDITDIKQRENEMQTISTLSKVLRTATTRARMLPIIVQPLVTLLDCNSVSVEIIDPLTNGTTVEAVYGAWAPLIGHKQPPETGLNAQIIRSRRSYCNNHILTLKEVAVPGLFNGGIRAVAGAPLIVQEQLLGILWMGRSTEISESEVRLLAAVADITANALNRSTLHEQTQQDAAKLRLAYDTTLEGWARTLELRDIGTEGHARRVVEITLVLANRLGISQSEMENVRRGALLHDIGKVGIPDAILLKQGALTEQEWAVMRLHPVYAYDLLAPIDYLRPALDIPHYHHEKWDGTGYPCSLKGEEIPLQARIFAIVDVWDALLSDRPYRPAWTKEKALEHIREQTGKHFDPLVVEVFMDLMESQDA